MSVKAILQGQNDKTPKLHVEVTKLPEQPSSPIAAGEEIPWSWAEINAIALSGNAESYFSLGSLKKCNLSTAVLGSTNPKMMVIGINQDADGTVTFQTQNCLEETTAFGNNAQWIGSTARQLCQDFYNACETKNFIKVVSKGTCPDISTGEDRDDNVIYNDETVWLPSEMEMGVNIFSPLSVNNSSITNAECTQGKKFSYTYYISDNNRKKKQSDIGSTCYYWERSRSISYATNVCCINYNGHVGSSDYSHYGDYGLAPAFVIGVSSKPTLIQDNEDVTNKVKEAINAADKDELNSHVSNTTMHTTAEEKSKIANAVTSSGVVLNEKVNSALPAKPSSPIAADVEIPWTWKQINAITCAGKATEYFSVGSLKKCTLTNAVLGSTEPMMRVIGIGQDADNTVTFQTKDCLKENTKFGSNSQWIDSTVRSLCQNFYNTCEAKPYIKIVSKGTCSDNSTASSRNDTVTYNNETVFLLSEMEMGLDEYSPLSTANAQTAAECTQGKKFSYAYFTSNNNRAKKVDGYEAFCSYWERSRCYNGWSNICNIDTQGSAYRNDRGVLIHIAPAFVIGNPGALAGSPRYTLIQDSTDVTDKVSQAIGQVNPNLLDNWYFGNPVNQRGQTSYTGAGYCIDRWRRSFDGSATISIVEEGIQLVDNATTWHNFEQVVEQVPPNTIVTMSFLVNNSDNVNQIFSFNIDDKDVSRFQPYDGNLWTMTFNTGSSGKGVGAGIQTKLGQTLIVYAAKLELGDTQTLAHKDEYGNWVLNEIPDYGEQLWRCQRYFQRLGFTDDYSGIGSGVARTSTLISIQAILPVELRARPSLNIIGNLALRHTDTIQKSPTAIYVDAPGKGMVLFACSASNATAGDAYEAFLAPKNYIDLSADL